jgi:hypothetical protein
MHIELFRTGHDMWGRTVLEGVSWTLIWVALAIGLAVILFHQIYRLFRRGKPGGR